MNRLAIRPSSLMLFFVVAFIAIIWLVAVPKVSTASQIIAAGAVVRHAPEIKGRGRVEGSVRQLLAGEDVTFEGEDVTLAGGAVIIGDLLVPGTPMLVVNGNPTFGGVVVGTGNTQPSGYKVTLNGNIQLGRLVTRTDAILLPTVNAPPVATGTRDVTLNAAGQSAGDFATLILTAKQPIAKCC